MASTASNLPFAEFSYFVCLSYNLLLMPSGVDTNTQKCTYTHTDTETQTYTHRDRHIHKHTRVHTRTYTHAHIHTHANTHMINFLDKYNFKEPGVCLI